MTDGNEFLRIGHDELTRRGNETITDYHTTWKVKESSATLNAPIPKESTEPLADSCWTRVESLDKTRPRYVHKFSSVSLPSHWKYSWSNCGVTSRVSIEQLDF